MKTLGLNRYIEKMKTQGFNRYIGIGPIVEMNKSILLNHRKRSHNSKHEELVKSKIVLFATCYD